MEPSPEWRITLTNSAEKGLRKLALADREAVATAIDRLPDGDTRKLQGRASEFRLRVGSLRVVFHLDRNSRSIEIRDVFQRGQGY